MLSRESADDQGVKRREACGRLNRTESVTEIVGGRVSARNSRAYQDDKAPANEKHEKVKNT
jgi:hypothetical protein